MCGLRPRMPVDVSTCSLATTVQGIPISMPVRIAPLAYQCLACAEGECDTARAAGQAETLIDAPRLGSRERDLRNGFGLPPHLRMANFIDGESSDVSQRKLGASAIAVHAGGSSGR